MSLRMLAGHRVHCSFQLHAAGMHFLAVPGFSLNKTLRKGTAQESLDNANS